MTRVLLVEDSAVARRSACLTLHGLGCEVLCAEHGEEAIELLRRGEWFDLMLIDVGLPDRDRDGLDLVNDLRAVDPELADIPVVVLTANDDAINRARAQVLGVRQYLIKPLTPAVAKEVLAYCKVTV